MGRAGHIFYWPKCTLKTWVSAFLLFYRSDFFSKRSRHKKRDHILIEQVLLHPKLVRSNLKRAGNFFYWAKCALRTWISAFLLFYPSDFFRQDLAKKRDHILIEQDLLYQKLVRSNLERAGNFFLLGEMYPKNVNFSFFCPLIGQSFSAKTRHEKRDHILIEQVLVHPKLLKPKLRRVGNFSYLPKCTLETWF